MTPTPMTNLLDGETYQLSTTGPTHDPEGTVNVLFVGWSETAITDILTKDDTDKLADLITEVTIDAEDVTVYAVWGYDTTDSGTPDVLEDMYTITYDVNDGNDDGPTPMTNLLDGETYQLSTTGPTHDPEGTVNVLFVGWSETAITDILTKDDTDKLADLITEVTIDAEDVTVYAVWGYDTTDNGTPDVLEDMYTITYDVNDGNDDGPTPMTNLLDGETYQLSATGPTHDPEGTVNVLFPKAQLTFSLSDGVKQQLLTFSQKMTQIN